MICDYSWSILSIRIIIEIIPRTHYSEINNVLLATEYLNTNCFLNGIRFASFYGWALEGPIDLDRLDHLYAVFSKPPEAMPLDEFIDWYHTHARENLTADGFDAVWRYRLESVDSGTCVTESYEVRWIPVWARIVDVPGNRHRELQEAMRHTLQQLKTACRDGRRPAVSASDADEHDHG